MYRLSSKDGKVAMADLKAIIFDCDGVLVNTEYLKFLAWQETLAADKYGNTSFTIQEYMPLIGGSSTAILAEIIKLKPALAKLDTTDLINEKNALYATKQAAGVSPIPEAVDFLQDLLANKQQYGLKIGLASSANRQQISENLKQLKVEESSFDAIVSGSSDLPKGTNKPNPAIYNLIAEQLQVKPNECLVFEDSNDGVVSAADAGMTVVALPNEYTKTHDFSRAALTTNLGVATFEQVDQDVNLSTDEILQQPPFNLTDEQDRKDFLQFAKTIDITLDDFLLGKVYKKKPYSYAQQQEIAKDLANIFAASFTGKKPSDKPEYVCSAGAPGVGKSTYVETNICSPDKVYIDPDRQALRFMAGYKEMSQSKSGEQAYVTYRDGSNYIANFLMVWALHNSYSIAHGTTATNPKMAKTILPGIKNLGYKINVHVLFADAEARKNSLEHRVKAQDFYQVTDTDARGKVAPVFDRLSDAFVKYADNIDMYYNTGRYWENTTKEQSEKCLLHFATFDRKKDAEHILINPADKFIIDKLEKDVAEEVKPENQQAVFSMFEQWFKVADPALFAKPKPKP